jgi:hypothetical protein
MNSKDKIRVLFIGNSYTFQNNLPVIFKELCDAADRPMDVEMVAEGGKSLDWHLYQNPKTIQVIENGPWDIVVLQDHSLQTILEPERFMHAVVRLSAKIKATGAIPFLYATWAREKLPETQETISNNYARAAAAAGVAIAPVGDTWQAVKKAVPDVTLYKDDGSHPNFTGSYLTACVLFAAIFQASPIGLKNSLRLCDGTQAVVDPALAKRFQEIIWGPHVSHKCSG